MRPPHCAGEILRGGLLAGLDVLASMRPPHCAGEIGALAQSYRASPSCFNEAPALRGGNRRFGLGTAAMAGRFNEAPALRGGNHQVRRERPYRPTASMRPPHCAGEIVVKVASLGKQLIASMRPPHCAGEIEAHEVAGNGRRGGFNEAPALRGGNRGRARRASAFLLGFNEAPALRGGNLWRRSARSHPGRRFNEAPALRGGNPAARGEADGGGARASMRPPHCAGEIVQHAADSAIGALLQ